MEVLQSVSSQVPVPEAWEKGVLDRGDLPPSLSANSHSQSVSAARDLCIGLLSQFFLSAYRDSQAAGALDYFFDQDESLRWLDSGPTGWPKASASARTEGLSILAFMSRYIDRCEQAYQAGHFDDWPRSASTEAWTGKYSNLANAQRLREIVFDRNELMQFLHKHHIPTSLLFQPDELLSYEAGMGDQSVASPHSSLASGTSSRSRLLAQDRTPAFAERNSTRSKTRRNELDPAIDKAIELAGSDSTVDVLLKLKELAIEGEPPFSGIVSDEGLEYTEVKTNKKVFLNRNQLDSRLRRRRTPPVVTDD
jgi:hypothetical protein